MSCGTGTGCVSGHGPFESKVPVAGYAMWLMWSTVSKFVPSQHLLPVRRPTDKLDGPDTINLRWKSDVGHDAGRANTIEN